MSTLTKMLFVASALVVFYSVGIVQAIVEVSKGESIQILDVFTDTFITPSRRLNKVADNLEKLSAKLDAVIAELEKGKEMREARAARVDTAAGGDVVEAGDAEEAGEWDSYEAETRAEEATVFATHLTALADSVNRYKSADTTKAFYRDMYVLRKDVTAYYETFYDNSDDIDVLLAGAGRLKGQVEELAATYPRPSGVEHLWLPVKHFFYHTAFNSRYLRSYENEMETSSVFSIALRPHMQFFRYCTMRDLGSKGITGRDGWFFYKPGYEYLVRPSVYDPRSVEVDANDTKYADDPVGAILTFKRQLGERGIDLLFVLVPGKASIYPDMMSELVDPSLAGTLSHSTKLLATLADSGVDVVDLFSAFAEERTHDEEAGESIYLEKDTHWRARGLRAAAAAVAARVKQYPWYREGTTEYAIERTSVMRDGDVGIMSKLPDYTIGQLRLQFELEKTPCYQVYEVYRGSDGEILRRKLYGRQSSGSSDILLIGDSFTRIYQHDPPRSAGWVAHLAAELKQPVFYDYSDGGSSTLMRQKLARNTDWLDGKKLVIWEVVERDVRYGAEGWKDVEL
ncbi:MAG: hypothetical protein GF418_12935 [Chitinivibrionales bacterium]|nr:hypothetical protein [Chitinivibrionales bacterium]MBD3396524.1 hypothetical protein [Chitinivibrionales bacterium]